MLRLTRGSSVFFVNPHAVILINRATLADSTPPPADADAVDNKVGEVKPITRVFLQDGSILAVDEHPGEVAVLIERVLHEERHLAGTYPSRSDKWKGE